MEFHDIFAEAKRNKAIKDAFAKLPKDVVEEMAHEKNHVGMSKSEREHHSHNEPDVEVLPKDIAEGTVYKIHLVGDIEKGETEKNCLVLTPGSAIKNHGHEKGVVEEYVVLDGDISINHQVADKLHHCAINETHGIDKSNGQRVVLSVKYHLKGEDGKGK